MLYNVNILMCILYNSYIIAIFFVIFKNILKRLRFLSFIFIIIALERVIYSQNPDFVGKSHPLNSTQQQQNIRSTLLCQIYIVFII